MTTVVVNDSMAKDGIVKNGVCLIQSGSKVISSSCTNSGTFCNRDQTCSVVNGNAIDGKVERKKRGGNSNTANGYQALR